MEVYIKGGHGYDYYDCFDTYIMLCSAIIAVYSKGVFADAWHIQHDMHDNRFTYQNDAFSPLPN